jgi:uncharacterized membrane protein YkvA (DUF1232 family)
MKIFGKTLYEGYRWLLRESKYRWIVILGSFIYLFSPFDISPDMFPVVGWIDDGLVLTLLMSEVSQILLDKVKARKDQEDEVQPETTTNSGSASLK